MRHRDAPELLADRVAARELLALGVADRQCARVVGLAVAVKVQRGAAIDDIDDLDDQAAVRRNPGGARAVVVAGRHRSSNREA